MIQKEVVVGVMNLNGWGVPQGMLVTESGDLEVQEESWKVKGNSVVLFGAP